MRSVLPDWAKVGKGVLYRRIFQVEKLRIMQGAEGNYGRGEYMRGFYNGLELACAVLMDRQPKYKDMED